MGGRQRNLANAQDRALDTSASTLAILARSVSKGSADGNLADASGWYGPPSPQSQNPLAHPVLRCYRPVFGKRALTDRAGFVMVRPRSHAGAGRCALDSHLFRQSRQRQV
jgi:hypothetical protein